MLKSFLFILRRNLVDFKIYSVIILFLSITIIFSAAPLSVEIGVDRSEVYTGERIDLTVTVYTEGAPSVVSVAGPEKLAGTFELGTPISTNIRISENKYKNIGIYPIIPLKAGAFETPVLFVYSDDTLVATSSLIYLDVYEREDEFGLSDRLIPTLKKYPEMHKPIFLGAVILLVFLSSLRIYSIVKGEKPSLKLKREKKIDRASDILKEYSEMKKKYLKTKSPEEIRSFYYDMSRILRDYVDRIYGIDLMESTPEEAESIFQVSNEFTPSIEKRIVIFMEKCDSIKYSRTEIGKTELRSDYEKFQRLFKRVLKDIEM